jgi:hypothetical protein
VKSVSINYLGTSDTSGTSDISENDELPVRSFSNELKIQVIVINKSIHKYVESFDIDVCKNLFYYDNTFKLDINSLSGIYNKVMKIHLDQNFQMSRINKYIFRGFKIETLSPEEEIKLLSKICENVNHKLYLSMKEVLDPNPFEIKCDCKNEMNNCLIEKYAHILKHEIKHKHLIPKVDLQREYRNKIIGVSSKFILMDTNIVLI